MDGCFLGWLLLSIFSDFEQVKNYFADSEQVKKTNSKTPVGKTRCLCMVFFICLMPSALHPAFSDLWGSPPALSSTPTFVVFFFFECIGIQFFNSLHAMSCQRSLTLIPREAEDFPKGDNHSKHVSLPIYLAWLQPIYYNF